MDGYTILVIFMLFCGFMSIGWICNSLLFKLASTSSFLWASANVILVGHVLLFTWRSSGGPEILTYNLNDLLLLLSMCALRGGVEKFTGKKISWPDYLGTVLVATAVLVAARTQVNHGQALAVIAMSAFWGYHLARTGHGAYAFMRTEFSRSASLVTVLPILGLSVLFVLRIAITVFAEDNSKVINPASDGLNAMFYLSVLICAVAFNSSVAGLAISRLIAKIHQLSIEDSLCKIANRRHIEMLIETELEISRRERKTFSLVMLDVDHFKSVNDKYGHAAGDAALLVCANVLKKAVRGSDHVGRVGGEEFCALLPNTDQDGALLTAERMRSLLENEVLEWEGHRIPLTASFGVVTYVCDNATSSDLFKRADSAMYRAKHEGRNRVITALAS